MAAFAVLFAAAAVGIYLLQQQSTAPVDKASLPKIQDALTHVPAYDVPGKDIAGVPRPAGGRRAYYVETKAVVSLVYSQHEPLLDVKHVLQPRLEASGWKPVGTTGSPAPSTLLESARAWTEVYFEGDRVLQVSMYRNSDVTSTTYVVQQKAP